MTDQPKKVVGGVFTRDGRRLPGRVEATAEVDFEAFPYQRDLYDGVSPGSEERSGTIRMQAVSTEWETAIAAHLAGFKTALTHIAEAGERTAARMRELAKAWEGPIRFALEAATEVDKARLPVLLDGPKVRWGFPGESGEWRTRADAIRNRTPWWARWRLDGVTLDGDGTFG